MENKSYEQMRNEFDEFYYKKIKPRLAQYEKERREDVPKIIAFNIMLFSCLLGFILIIPSKQGSFTSTLGFISIGILACASIWFYFLIRNESKEIEFDLEHKLKRYLMRSFLEIFSKNADWHKGLTDNYWEKTDFYRKSNIFNPFPFALFDDTIYLVFKNIEINIYETKTSVFNHVTVVFIPFILIIFGLFFAPLLSISLLFIPILLIVVIPTLTTLLIILLLFSIKKILQYAPFKGVVIELKMNKNFKGHTFFLNKSLNSKKITINHRKYENVQLESVDFMNKYEVFSTDQVEARYLLTTAMMDRLDHLKLAFKANYIRGSFKDDKLILAIDSGKDMFAMGNNFKESNKQTFIDLFNEIVSVLKIVDQLKLDEKTGL